ncbi:Replication initiator protein A [Lacipirellula limnantheis]|uniref:Replication initiator protein A n=1 Tax=Lacipirellula limnantheis TaxID=2528024 RepID=A0A517TSF7_9BACT|nr:Replication initiator protein A [Lacipirellula limnantheis]
MTEENNRNEGNVVPLYGKDEMNLVEFPFGPITATGVKTLEVEHQAFDRVLKREVTRQLIMTGSDKWGLPRPIDDQVLLGLKTLTHETGFASPQIVFSRYQLCRAIGWEPDGRTYRRLEQSIDRIAGTTFKFKDAWWDNGEKEYKSKTFHLITDVEICSRDQLDRSRIATGRTEQQLCSVRWGEAIWKSFQDGFIRTLDMRMFRRIAQGRRREVPLRLYRILDKRFWHAPVARFNLSRLCIGTLGLSPTYSPSQMKRVLDRAAAWLVECGCLHDYRYATERSVDVVYFREKSVADVAKKPSAPPIALPETCDTLKQWLVSQTEGELWSLESVALEAGFGSELERTIVVAERAKEVPLLAGRRIRQEYVRRYAERQRLAQRNAAGAG